MNTFRAFIAIGLDDPTHQALSEIQILLKKTGADVAWVKPNNAHLTLKFLGEISTEKIGPVAAAVESICHKKHFTAELTRLGAFPTVEHPQIIWIGVEKGGDHIREIARDLEESLEKIGFKKEKRGFDPHVTLGRCRSSLNRFTLFKAMKDYPPRMISQEIRQIIFFKSTLAPQGPVYEAIKIFPLVS